MQLITERQNIDNYLRRVTSECISRLEGVLIEDEAVTATRELLKRLQALVPGSCSVEDVHRAINGTLRKTYGSPKPTCGECGLQVPAVILIQDALICKSCLQGAINAIDN